MKRSSRSLTAALACAAALIAVPGLAAPASAATGTVDLMLFGDSYSAGNGAGDYTNLICGRSPNTWGQLYAANVRAKGYTVNVTNNACSGSHLEDFDQQVADATASLAKVDVVGMTIGGNDVGFATVVRECFAPILVDLSSCKADIEAAALTAKGVEDATVQRLLTLRSKMHAGSKVVIPGAPYLALDNGYILRQGLSSYNAVKAVRALGDQGDLIDAHAAARVNAQLGESFVTFAPMHAKFATHEPDSDPYHANPNGWLWEFSAAAPSPQDFWHPNKAGHQAEAAVVTAAAGSTGIFGAALQ